MDRPTPKSSFRKAVDYLKEKGVITRDQDLLKHLGITSKGTLSNYLKHGLPPHLQVKFQNKFEEDLRQFSNGTHATEPAKSIEDKYTRLLEEQLAWIKEQVRVDLSTVKTGLTGISGDIIYARATQRAILEFQLMKESKGDQKKVEFAKEQINKLIALQLTEDEQVGTDVVSDKSSRP